MSKMQSTNPGKGYEIIGQVEENKFMENKQICGVLVIPFKRAKEGLRFLLLKHKDGFWTFPGGMKEKDDKSIIDCLKREIKEEIGLEVKDSELKNTGFKNEFFYGAEKQGRTGQKGVTYFFTLEIKGKEHFNSFHNIEKIAWFDRKEVLERISLDDISQMFLRVEDKILN